MTAQRVAIATYSVKPRGGAVHSVELAEALAAQGADVTLVALGDPQQGFFRPTGVPLCIIESPAGAGPTPAALTATPPHDPAHTPTATPAHTPTATSAHDPADSLTERVFAHIEAMTSGLAAMRGRFDIVHAQDCISARAAARVRDAGGGFTLIRTVHHIDDFTTPALIECQDAAIVEPDRVLVVSEPWRRRLLEDYGVDAEVVTNGVRVERFAAAGARPGVRERLRARIDAADRHLFLTVGGIEPRKGSRYLMEALGLLKGGASSRAAARQRPGRGGVGPDTARLASGRRRPPANAPGASEERDAMLAIVGGHSFQDYRAYRDAVLGSLGRHGLRLGHDVVLLGTVADEELPGWFHAADSFVFPSVSEGWGLVVLEALAAGLPVVASDIEVFRDFLTSYVDAVLTATADPESLAAGMARVRDDPQLVRRLRANGEVTARRYSWSNTARQHADIYTSAARPG